jgi:excisionase family DNA binding protein
MKLEHLFKAISESDESSTPDKAPPVSDKLGEYITTAQAANILNVSMSRVRQFIMEKRLKSYSPEPGRRDNMLKLSEVQAFKEKDRERTGRPEGSKTENKDED